MKKMLTVVLLACMLAGVTCPALAMDMDRFVDVEGHTLTTKKTVAFGADVLDKAVDSKGRMVMVYTDMGDSYYEYPFMLIGFCGEGDGAQSLKVTTDERIYTIAANQTNALSALGIASLEGCATIVLDAETAEMIRDMLRSQSLKVQVGQSYDFAVTDEYRAELELILAEWDEEIASVAASGNTSKAYEVIMSTVQSEMIVTNLDGSEIGYPTLEMGSKGAEVIALQKYLISLGYLTGTADGDYGSMTVDAIRAFQGKAGLEKTGIADSATQEALYKQEVTTIPDVVIASVKVLPNPGRVPEIYMRLRNDGDTAIDRVDFRVVCYDAYGKQIYGYDYYEYVDCFYDIEIAPNTLSRIDWYWDLYGFEGTQSVDIAICKYHTAGGITVTLEEDELAWQHFEYVEEKED